MIYSDITTMPFGKHLGKPIGQLPADYLLWLRDNCTTLHEGFKTYIDNKRSTLEIEALAEKQRANAQRILNMK